MSWLCNILNCNKPEQEKDKDIKLLPAKEQLYHFLINTRFPKSLHNTLIAQWIYESGHFKSDLAVRHFNFAGLKYRNEMSNYCTKVEYNAHDGIDYYCKFDSIEAFVIGYEAFMNRPVYNGVWNHLGSGIDYLRFIVARGYCPSKGYIENILKIEKTL